MEKGRGNLERALSRKEAAVILGVCYDTLRRWESQGKGPRYFQEGEVVRYQPEDLRAWMEERKK